MNPPSQLSPEENQLIAELGRDFVAQTAPEELPIYRPLCEAYFKDPQRALRGETGKDESLGFGLSEAALLVTPLVLDVVKDIVSFLMVETVKSIKQKKPGEKRSLILRLFKKSAPVKDVPEPTLTPEQIAQVRRLALEKARLLSMPEGQALLLADAIAGSLAAKP